ncbi:gliding motility lipoprotein GldB [Cytophagales bacterium LB-30]|uniref:Gliding motility lipoprotein GldB n=1 Tax=Shiella aurantiaca TaxID=3058365 RepID=A0ABT8F8A7_9BACT|nr:gliding motility lipoprotein GldB [Shiella aurantiaca]MDN4166711.1 gliding motility lipoprotein GldB [Shiella aurantiaca]
MRNILSASIIALLLLGACSSESERCNLKSEYAAVSVQPSISRLDHELMKLRQAEEVIHFMDAHPAFADNFLGRQEYPHDSLVVNSLLALVQNPGIDTLYQEIQATFPQDLLNKQFTEIFQAIRYYYPDFELPQIEVGLTGFANDMYVNDKLLILGLDFYLGENATYRPINIPQYILRRYTPEHLMSNSLLFISQKFNLSNETDRSMLADMVYYGKSMYFIETMLPCTPDSLIIGYTAEEVKDTEENADIIWANFIQNELIYETDYTMKLKFLGERPKTVEIGNKCPGRIGMWLGWQIVRQYMERNPEVSLPELMADTNAQKIFEKSRYKPRT